MAATVPPDQTLALRPISISAAETLPLAIDFTALLGSSETLSGSPTITISPAGPTIASAAVLAAAFTPVGGGDAIAIGKGLSCLLSGCRTGVRYQLVASCGTTTTSRVVAGRVTIVCDP